MHNEPGEKHEQRDVHRDAPVARRRLHNLKTFDVQGFAGAITGIRSSRACAALAASRIGVTRQVASNADLIANLDVSDLIANGIVS